MAPTLFTSCNALPPEGAGLAWGGPALAAMAPTLFTSCNALPGLKVQFPGSYLIGQGFEFD